ncbi:RNA-binding S4 domain-containing protein [Terriglobus roseus]|uniref:Heat shock protein Hsp15 n=1 Tax=Terriglobus roseus TaxID=392734 RepID=A0A1H4KMH4_9BACT|nr:RNA-binding S4 domain-containing protein [Terriglobus roseus]SEB59779.1 heat shock protein Hsp15 [Terriglobus roseus]
MDAVRIDKWLWASRFYKTRALAVKACELGRVKLRDLPAKPSRDVKVGDAVTLTNDSGTYVVDVLALSDVRGPAAVAQTLYRETEASTAARKKEEELRKNSPWADVDTAGRPSKRDRRDINRLRGR